MNKMSIKILLIATLLVIGTIFVAKYDWYPRIVVSKGDITKVGTLKTVDGSVIGDIYVTYRKDSGDVFTSLIVSKEVGGSNIIVYKINNEGFFSTLGVDKRVEQSSFYGYKLSMLNDSLFVVNLVDGKGNISDGLTVVWNTEKSVLEIERMHYDDENMGIAQLGTLVDHNGTTLGKIEGLYTVEDKNIYTSLFVVKEGLGEERFLYKITDQGLSNTNGKDVVITNLNEAKGFKLSRVQGDQFVVNYLSKDGKYVSSDIIVRWNYDKKIFESQK